jgi:SAM-dependent methyltransferase
VVRFASLIRRTGTVLDLACGDGRHTRLLRKLGFSVVAVDRDAAALDTMRDDSGIERVCADLEAAPWPFAGRAFDGIVVTRYLHRPLFAALREALASDGVLIYETFAEGNARFGRPSNPAFLLRRDELLDEARGLVVVAFEQGEVATPQPAVVQRICAVRSATPARIPEGSHAGP